MSDMVLEMEVDQMHRRMIHGKSVVAVLKMLMVSAALVMLSTLEELAALAGKECQPHHHCRWGVIANLL